ncbi:hypothetical protein P9112_005607 [Eukaryota sp. TZLM1-RC]
MSDDSRRFVELAKLYKRTKANYDSLLQTFNLTPLNNPSSLSSALSHIATLSSFYEQFCMQEHDPRFAQCSSDKQGCRYYDQVQLLKREISEQREKVHSNKQLLTRVSLRLKEVDFLSIAKVVHVGLFNEGIGHLKNCFIVDDYLFVPKSTVHFIVKNSDFNGNFITFSLNEFNKYNKSLIETSCRRMVDADVVVGQRAQINDLNSQLAEISSEFRNYKQQALEAFKSLEQEPSTVESTVTSTVESVEVAVSTEDMQDDLFTLTQKLINLREEYDELKEKYDVQKFRLLDSGQSQCSFSIDEAQLAYLQSVFLSFMGSSSKVKKSLVPVLSDLLKFDKNQQHKLRDLI